MRRERVSPPMGNGAQLPRWRKAATHRIALAKLTPNRFAAARQLMPSSPTAATTRARKSTDKGPIPRRLRFGAPQESDFHRMGIAPDSTWPGTALASGALKGYMLGT